MADHICYLMAPIKLYHIDLMGPTRAPQGSGRPYRKTRTRVPLLIKRPGKRHDRHEFEAPSMKFRRRAGNAAADHVRAHQFVISQDNRTGC